ncbi:MFS transporter [Chitinophaga nivalis]|uniref:MFS transporter n=1 Tax=Chitinophaga nivalis TaxID=2991709 RepID=A0ABT3IK30_9BACT|nr:MFS transporter [Chitinophaga nivalis]MCW3466021.1 MFS transporter [Chitinophaga nivalis]MCW3484288.1 MFS transporter [Chitinophaga nivalis]
MYRKKIILFILLIAAVLSPLDFYIVNLALTAIQQDLHAEPASLQMIVSFYTAAYAVFQITGGRLGDLMGRKRMFLCGLFGFITASLICGCAPDTTVLIAGRVLQGIAGAIMAPQVLAIIQVVYTPEEKIRVMGYYSFTFGLAAVLGQLLGGLLIAMNIAGLGWKVIFLINVPIGIVALIAGLKYLPEHKSEQQGPIDWLGICLLSACLLLVIYPLTCGFDLYWPLRIKVMLGMSIPVLLLFFWYENRLMQRGRTPLIDMRILRYPQLAGGIGTAFLFYTSGIFYLALGLFLQNGLHWQAMQAGLAIIPFGLGFLICSLAAASITRYIGDRILLLGISLYAAGFTLMIAALWQPAGQSGILFYVGLWVAGMGMGFTLSSIVRISLNGIPQAFIGLGSGLINFALQIGSALGVALIGQVFFDVAAGNNYAIAFRETLMVVVVLLLLALVPGYRLVRKQAAVKKGQA